MRTVVKRHTGIPFPAFTLLQKTPLKLTLRCANEHARLVVSQLVDCFANYSNCCLHNAPKIARCGRSVYAVRSNFLQARSQVKKDCTGWTWSTHPQRLSQGCDPTIGDYPLAFGHVTKNDLPSCHLVGNRGVDHDSFR